MATRGYALWGVANAIYVGCNDVFDSDKLTLVEALEDYLKGHPPAIQSLPRRIKSDYQKYVGARPTKKPRYYFCEAFAPVPRPLGIMELWLVWMKRTLN